MRFARCVVVTAVLATAGCGGGDGSSSNGGDSATPAESASIEGSGADGVLFTVTQADDDCTLTGPNEVRAGETYYILVKNPTDLAVALHVSLLTDGATYQEVVELQPSPGEYFPQPPFVESVSHDWEATLKFRETTDLADDESGHAYSSEPGPHAVVMGTSAREPRGLWLCGSFDAT